MKPISIAIDGPSGAGKSTIARKSAEKFGFIYVDTGAIYRTVGLAAYRRGIASKDSAAVIAMLPELHIELRHGADGLQRMFLDGEDVSDAIRMPEISIYASDVSAVPKSARFSWRCSVRLHAHRISSWTDAISAPLCCRTRG